MTTATRKPPMKTSDEATEKQLAMARAQGEKYVEALRHMAEDVADDGGEKRAGDYVVAYAVEEAEGMWKRNGDGELAWEEPEDENCHLEISVRDAADNRFVPGLEVTATVKDGSGKELVREKLPLLWHPWLYHYGRNIELPEDGKYTVHVKIAAPDFHRHDEKNGKRYAEDVEVTFEGVEVELGQE